MKKILSILIPALALIGCSSQKQVPTTLPPVVLHDNDSIRVETVIKTIYVPVTAEFEIPQQSASNVTTADSSHVETDIAESDAWLNPDGTLGHTINNKPGKLETNVYVPQTTEQNNRDAVKVKEVPVPEPYPVEIERRFTVLEQIKLAAFWYLVSAVIVCIGFLFRKPLFTALRKIIRL